MTEKCGTDVDCGGPKMGPLQWNMECDEFRCWSELLKTRTGIAVPAERKSFLIRGLRNRMNEVGYLPCRAMGHQCSVLR